MSKSSLESVLNLCIAFIASTIILISCGEDEVGKSGIDMSNTSPVIDDFIAPTEANAGEEVTLKVVSHDQEGDVLTYTWEVSGGKLSSRDQETVVWIPPQEPRQMFGRFLEKTIVVTVTVSDKISNPVYRSRQVKVRLLNRIEPSEFVAGIMLGYPLSKVQMLYGEASVDKKTDMWLEGANGEFRKQFLEDNKAKFFAYEDLGIYLAVAGGTNVVIAVDIELPNKSKTERGFGLGSSFNQISSELGPAEKIFQWKDNMWHYYEKKKIHILYDNNSIAQRIGVL